MKKFKGFTLSETMIVLVVLGVITVLVVPQLVKRQQEVQNRAKIKKAMSVYDYLINRIVLENDIKSTNGLKTWADNDCTNSSSYFKVVKNVDNSKCKFKTSDGVYWDISHIEKPIIALKSGDLKDEIAEAPNSNKAFYFLAKFDDQGILRVSDVQYETLKGTNDDKQAMIKLSNFVKGVKVEAEEPEIECTTNICKVAKYKDTPCQEPNGTYYANCTNCTGCYTYNGDTTIGVYDETGKIIAYSSGCLNEKCENFFSANGTTGEFKYDENGDKEAELANRTADGFYTHCEGLNCDKYLDHVDTQDVEKQRWVSTGGQTWVEEVVSGSGYTSSFGYWKENGYWETYTETVVTERYYK